ncbi:transposable element Tc1 transposase [Trichonephila clavipes]|nr:transposable element Tc1 transposase [Trichonephila clavipes]
MTKTTPELALPLQTTTAHQREDFELERSNVNQPPLHDESLAASKLEPATHPPKVPDHNHYTKEWKRGRKSILSDVAKRKVLKDIKIDPKLSAVKLAAETSRIMGRSVSAETVRNVIRHAGYSSRVARKKHFISLQNQKKRLEFAKAHQLKTDKFWKKVIFSDESKFNIFGSDGRRTVWRKPNTALDPKNLHPTVKHGGGSVMQLHTPPQSPDINVIENLWTTLETAVQKHQIRNKAHLKQVLQEEWDKISPDTTKKLVESVPRRLEDIIKAKGHATKY